jgi:hypothetical protein
MCVGDQFVKTRDRKRDPTLMLVIFAVLVGAFALRVISNLRITLTPPMLAALTPSLAMVALSMCALALLRFHSTATTLRDRVSFAVVPADEFDPDAEAVLRFAAQLARLDRTVRGWLDRRASAIRIRLEADGEGRLVYLLEVPGRSRELLLRSALRSYEGIELRGPADVRRSGGAEGEGKDPTQLTATARAELMLSRPSVEPLGRVTIDPDPLGPCAAAMRALRCAEGEEGIVCVDLLPAVARRRARLRRRLEREARRLYSARRGWHELLGREGDSRREPAELAERRAEAHALDSKLKDSGPLFEAQVLIRCRAADPARAKAALRGLLASFEQLAGRNWLRVSGLPIPGVAFLGSDLPLRRGPFDRRLASGYFRPARRSIVTAQEMVGWLKPPTQRCITENVLRSGALVAPPPPLDAFAKERGDLIPLGRIATEAGEQVVGVAVADTFFSYCAGRSRYGKTELAVAQFLHLVRSGQGGLFLDPHEDAVTRIKGHLTDAGLRDRVVEINLADANAAQPAWNVLGVAGTAQAEGQAEAMVDAFASALRWDERNTRAINLTTQGAQALAAVAAAVPDEMAPTIFQLPTLLSDPEWREAALPFLPKPARGFWTDRFPLLAEEAITPLTNMVDRLRASSAITALLGQSQSTYRAREAMDRGKIVLACPGSGGTRDRLIANLLLFDVLHAAKGRADTPPDRRRPFWLFLDEVQTYDGAASGNLAGLLEQSAKYGVRAFLLNQNPERLIPQTLNAVTTNRSHLLSTALNARAAGLIAKEWGGRPDPAALTRLPRYRFLAQVTHGGELSKPFSLGGVTVEELFGPGHPEQVAKLEEAIDENAGRKSAAETLAHLDDLDDRIYAELQKRLDGGGEAEGSLEVQFDGGQE